MNITLLKSYSNRKKNTLGLFAENYYAFVTNQEAFAQLDSEGKKKSPVSSQHYTRLLRMI